jgi:putative transposase
MSWFESAGCLFMSTREILRLYILKYHKTKISKNKLHNYLRELEIAKPDKKKQKQRKYCRYERKHSFSLGHMDYHESRYDGRWTVVWIDDVSRLILAGEEFKEADTKNVKWIVETAIKKAEQVYSSTLRELNTDKGTQFFNTRYNKMGIRTFGEFEKFLVEKNIKHIPSKRNHPQTNGKNERWFWAYEENRAKFKSFGEFIEWYNDRIHLGLSRTRGITPNEVVWNRMRSEAILGVFWRRFDR